MAGVYFEEANEVKEIAEELIDKYHPHLKDAKNLIGYYFREGASEWAGKAKKCTAFERFVTGKMLFVFINSDAWKAMKHDQREIKKIPAFFTPNSAI
jgi:Putative phage metallopeptidase